MVSCVPAKLIPANIPDAPKMAQAIFKSPLSWVKTNPVGTAARDAVLWPYRDVQKTLCTVGIVFAAISVPLAMFIENVRLDDRAQGKEATDTDSIETEETRNVDYRRNDNPIASVDSKNKY